MTAWAFDGVRYSDSAGYLPDGSDPVAMQIAWSPWVRDLTSMIDGFGCIRHLPCSGGWRDQPAIDMAIYEIIRTRWVELMNAKNAR